MAKGVRHVMYATLPLITCTVLSHTRLAFLGVAQQIILGLTYQGVAYPCRLVIGGD